MSSHRPTRPAAHAAIVAALLELARPELLRVFRRDSCIVSTRVALDVLKTFGIAARPLSVKAVVYNAPYAARLERGMPLPASADELACWVREDGAWSVGLGFPNPDAPPCRWLAGPPGRGNRAEPADRPGAGAGQPARAWPPAWPPGGGGIGRVSRG